MSDPVCTICNGDGVCGCYDFCGDCGHLRCMHEAPPGGCGEEDAWAPDYDLVMCECRRFVPKAEGV